MGDGWQFTPLLRVTRVQQVWVFFNDNDKLVTNDNDKMMG